MVFLNHTFYECENYAHLLQKVAERKTLMIIHVEQTVENIWAISFQPFFCVYYPYRVTFP